MAIPNDDDESWDRWINVGLCTYRATGGSEDGRAAWSAWSAKSAKFVPGACDERWAHFATSPPTRGGAGSIFFWAKAAGWKDPAAQVIQLFSLPAEYEAGDFSPDKDARGEAPGGVGGGPPGCDTGPEPPPHPGVDNPGDNLVTEGAVSDAFTREYPDQLRFCHHSGRWYLWNGSRWTREETKLAYRWAHQKAMALAAETAGARAIVAAGKASFAAGVERLAQSDRAFAVTNDCWDQDPWLLGTVDLRTGDIGPAVRDDYIRKQTTVTPADTADCPTWLAFLHEVTQGDEALVDFLQRWFGYCLTADTREQALVFVYGPGGNGKGVMTGTVFGIMGDYAINAAMDTFVATRGDKHTTDLAMLAGARMVVTTEVDEGQAWAEAKIKALTGGDPITARFMRQDNFTFKPRFKLTSSGNHKPKLRNADNAMRRRLNIVPFTHKPARVDRTLAEKLKKEWPEVLRWLIDGCIKWQQFGLNPPTVVQEATDDYFEAQDYFKRWLDECCALDPNASEKSSALMENFQQWCIENKEEAVDSTRFRGMLERTEGVHYKKSGTVKVVGISLRRRSLLG